jgi:hypothetical protein
VRCGAFTGVAGFAASLMACGIEALPNPSSVRDLRLLALTTETPEVRPGEAVFVRAELLDPRAPRTLHFLWRVCDATRISDPRSCPLAATAISLTGDSRVQVGPLRDGDEALVFVAVCPEVLPTFEEPTGLVRCGENQVGVGAFRRVRARAEGALNRPPIVNRWEITTPDGAVVNLAGDAAVAIPWCSVEPCTAMTQRVVVAPASVEVLDNGERESLSVAFYATAGVLDRPRDVANPGEVRPMTARWTPSPTERTATLAMVLRDQRGGEVVRVARLVAR